MSPVPSSINSNSSDAESESEVRAAPVGWPSDCIPKEIFDIIVSYLSRSAVQSMRLVNREFELKVSEVLFKTVVVQFRPEIYGITQDPIPETAGNSLDSETFTSQLKQHSSVVLQANGMQVFKGFGKYIRRFAMSFEIDYNFFTKPPRKSDQEAFTTFWGIYRWPFQSYHRYVSLEGLEQTADETRTMAQALRYITNSKELGLSIDGGLGWLAGPDLNTKATVPKAGLPVFGTQQLVGEEKKSKPSKGKSRKASSINRNPTSGPSDNDLEENPNSLAPGANEYMNALMQMLGEAGYQGPELLDSIQTLRESEGTDGESPSSTTSTSSALVSNTAEFEDTHELEQEVQELILAANPDADPEAVHFLDMGRPLGPESITAPVPSDALMQSSLKPNDLTTAQKETLLETEWAQRAFLQSYAIAVIDNVLIFENIGTLTIARLPSGHLSILSRKDFWDSLPSLNSLSLAIIPAWREIVKLPTTSVKDVPVKPSNAVGVVHELFTRHIASKASISSLHFEWLCGGEEAPGYFARNKHVLAAPLLSCPFQMIVQNPPESPLKFPHVKKFSMKNCWVSAEVLTDFVQELKSQKVETINLRSVSLAGPFDDLLMDGGNFLANHIQHHLFANMANNAGAPNFQQLPPLLPQPPVPLNPTNWSDPPRRGSWPQVIDMITPGRTLAQIRYDQGSEEEQPPVSAPTTLQTLNFDSCGYVSLSINLNQPAGAHGDGPRGAGRRSPRSSRRKSGIAQYMMVSDDSTLGYIKNNIHEQEVKTLENAWGLEMGWGIEKAALAAEVKQDGVQSPGRGRFRGSIMAEPTKYSGNV